MLNGTRQHFVDKQIFPAFMDDRWGDPGDFAQKLSFFQIVQGPIVQNAIKVNLALND